MTQTPTETIVTVFGGSGFVGRHVVRALAKRGYRVRAAVRRPELAGHLQPLGRVGQITAVQANVRYPESVASAVRDAAVVVNLVGILSEGGAQRFDAVQSVGAETVAQAAAARGARLIHVSALGADPQAPSRYAQSKAEGERAVLAADPHAIIMRPSVVFGPEDDLFNRFAGLARLMPLVALVGGGATRFQPVFVGDLAEAIALAVEGKATPGTIYEVGGPDVASFRSLIQYVLATIERKRLLVPLPFGLAKLLASAMQFMPKPLLTPDQVELLRRDNVVSDAARAEHRTLEGLGIEPTAMITIVPSYLWRFRRTGQFSRHAT